MKQKIANLRNEMANERYSKNHPPKTLDHVKPVCNDLSEREQLPSCSNSSHEQYIKAEGVCPTCGTTKTFEEQNQPDKATAIERLIAQLETSGAAAVGKAMLQQIKAEHAALVAVASAARCVSNAIDRQDDSMIEPNDVLVKALSQLSALRQG